jgi:hypothetical protein
VICRSKRPRKAPRRDTASLTSDFADRSESVPVINASDEGRNHRVTRNRAVTFMGPPHKMEVQDKGYPKHGHGVFPFHGVGDFEHHHHAMAAAASKLLQNLQHTID